MCNKFGPGRWLFAALLLCSLVPIPRAASRQLIPTEEITSGSSVFVFRESRRRPYTKLGGGTRLVASASAGRGRLLRSNSQIASAAEKRRQAAIAARTRAAAAADRRIALSNTLTLKAEEFLDSNRTDLAITNFRDALVQNPRNTRASSGLSNALTAKGIEVASDTDGMSAVVYFDEATRLDKQNDVAWAKLGAIYDAAGNPSKAAANYEQALAINPAYDILRPPLGLAYLAVGDVQKAEQQLNQSAAIDNADARLLRAVVLFEQNKNDEALIAIDRTLELDGRSVDAMYYRGQILDRLGRTEQAIAAFKNAVSTEPTFTPAAYDLGAAYYNAGDYNNAAAAYQEVIKSDPNNAEARAELGSTYRKLDRCDEANAEFRLAERGPRSPDLYSEWGYCLGKTGQWDESAAKLTTAAEMDPTPVDNSNAGWAYYNAGNSEAEKKDTAASKSRFEDAKKYLEKAVELDPRFGPAYVNLGSTHNALGEFQLALNVLAKALDLRGNWVVALNQLGYGYRGLKDLRNAIATFKSALDLDKRNTYVLYNLGEAYYTNGNKGDAKKINDQLRKLDPTMAAKLDNVIAGRIVDEAKRKVEQKIPIRIPRFP